MTDPFDIGPEFLGKVPLFAELQRLLRWDQGPVNWDIAKQIATATAATREGAGSKAVPQEAAEEAARHAVLLVESVTDLEAAEPQIAGPVAFGEAIITDARELFEAIATRANAGIAEGLTMPEQAPEGIAEALKSLGPLLHGAQTGNAIGGAASEAIGWCDLGLPIERSSSLLVPVVVGRITREHNLDERAALLTATLRVCVDHTVASSFTSLRTRFLSAFLELVSTLEHDASQLSDRLGSLDPSDPSSLEALMSGITFERSSASEAASAQVDAISALHSAAVDRFVSACAAQAGIDPATVAACVSKRSTEEVTAFRGMLGLGPADPAIAEPFVDAAIAKGGFELLRIALDDPIRNPSVEEIRSPEAWILRIS